MNLCCDNQLTTLSFTLCNYVISFCKEKKQIYLFAKAEKKKWSGSWKCFALPAVLRPNSWTQMGQKSEEFSFLLFTVISTNGFCPTPPPPRAIVGWNWFVMLTLYVYAETSSLRILKIVPRNLNKIGSSWIRLLAWVAQLCVHFLRGRIQRKTWYTGSYASWL